MKLADLQKKLKPAKLDGYLVTRNNMFLNQDVRNDENLVRLLAGFIIGAFLQRFGGRGAWVIWGIWMVLTFAPSCWDTTS